MPIEGQILGNTLNAASKVIEHFFLSQCNLTLVNPIGLSPVVVHRQDQIATKLAMLSHYAKEQESAGTPF